MDCLVIRKALFFAINTQALIDLNGGSQFYGKPGDGAIAPLLATDFAPTTGNIHDSNFNINGNPTYAKSLMEQAKTTCPAAYARATDASKGIVFDFPNTATSKKASALIQTALNAAGIQATFNFLESGTYYSYVQDPTKEDDIANSGWAADWPNASTVIPDLYTQNGGFDLTQNWTDPSYAEFAAKVSAAQAETNRAKQAADWKALNQYAMDQYWTIRPIFNLEQNQWNSGIGGADFWLPQGSLLFPALYVK
jgi:peptide/nickel transport system substrate-binding protein